MKALADFQKACPPIKKDTLGYNYRYSSLPTILEIVNPILQKNGLTFVQPLTQEGIKTILFHIDSGEMIESETRIPQVQLAKMNAYQALGSGITYFRRYSLCSLLGIVSDEDTDAAGDSIKDATTQQVARIDDLLRTSTLDDRQRKKTESEIPELTNERADRCIAYLLANQTEAKDGGGMKQKDINKELDLKMQDERQ